VDRKYRRFFEKAMKYKIPKMNNVHKKNIPEKADSHPAQFGNP
jgi:hypothetical protein